MPESYKEDARPSQQWYWNDWFSAFDVRNCCLAARGLWIDMLGIMWKAEIRGTLTVNGKQPDNKTLAKIVGSSASEIKPLLKELEMNNVFSRLDGGTIICRRMFRVSAKKDDISKIRSKAGKEGARKRWQKMAKNICHPEKDMAKNGKNPSRNDSKDSEGKMAKMAASTSTSSSTSSSNHKKDTRVSFMSSSFKDDIIFKWNTLAQKHNLAAIEGIKPGSMREKYLRARSAEKGFDFNLLIDMIENSPFLLGKTKNPFFVFFDWIIKPTNYQKIMEGNYLDRQGYQKFSGIVEGIKELEEKHRKEGRK